MKEYVPVAKDCEHCSKKKGSFGCCSTVSNNWVYSCAEGQKEWTLDKISAEIQRLRGCSCSCSDGIIDDVEDIIDKHKTEREG